MARAALRSGRMRCPKYGEVDVERCFNCVEFRNLAARRGNVELICSATGQPLHLDNLTLALLRQPLKGT